MCYGTYNKSRLIPMVCPPPRTGTEERRKGGYGLHGLHLEVALGGVVAFDDGPLYDFSREGDGEGLAFFIVASDWNCLAAIPLHGSDALVKLDENEIIADDGIEFLSGKKFHVGDAFR